MIIQGMKQYPISFWTTGGFNRPPEAKVEDWHDLGITLAMASSNPDNRGQVLETLDRANEYGMKVILSDTRANWRASLTGKGEDSFRRGMEQAIKDFGSHPAAFGFLNGDEPDAPDAEDAFRSVRITNEMAPHLTSYINLLPWFDWIGERMGTDTLAHYIDRYHKASGTKLFSFDCYTQMWEGERGNDEYFNNLREYYEAQLRLGVPYFSIVLSCGHYAYRCPSKNDMLWQLTTSAAHGASGVMWFFIELPGMWENYRNAPINQLGERTQEFGWLSEVNRVFNGYCGEIIADLSIEKCFHVGKSYGGVPLFEPFDNLVEVASKDDLPLIVSSFHDSKGEKYYIVCNNSPTDSSYVSVKIKGGVRMQRSVWGNKFDDIRVASDPIGAQDVVPDQSFGFNLAPAQLVVLKEAK